jgi:hypothetical protein
VGSGAFDSLAETSSSALAFVSSSALVFVAYDDDAVRPKSTLFCFVKIPVFGRVDDALDSIAARNARRNMK